MPIRAEFRHFYNAAHRRYRAELIAIFGARCQKCGRACERYLNLAHTQLELLDTSGAAPIPPVRAAPPKRAVNLTPAAQRILDAIAELNALRVAEPPRVQVAFMAGYTNLNSKGFTNAIGALRGSGLIDYPGAGTTSLTDAGRAIAKESAAPRSTDELVERLVAMLGGANGRIIRQLVDVYPDSLPREDLAARAGYGNTNSKGFTNAIGRLRTLGFIDYPAPGQVHAQPVLFLEGE